MDYVNMAKDEEKQAAKKLAGSFFGNLFGSKNERIEESMEHLKRAANFYKLGGKHEEAAVTYKRMADSAEQLKEFDDAADYLSSAGDMYAQFDFVQATNCLNKSAI